MNAVDAVERLTALGRRVQAQERLLQQPVAPLHVAPLWEQVLADPLLSLGALLAASGRAPHRPAAAAELRIPRPQAHLPPFAAGPSQPGAGRGDNSDAPAQQAPSLLPLRAPDAGVRLVRRQTSLLGILSANVDVNTQIDPGPAGSGHAGVRATPHGGAQAHDPHTSWVDKGGRAGIVQAGWADAASAPLDLSLAQPVWQPVSQPGMPEPFVLETASARSVRPQRAPDAAAVAPHGGAPTAAVVHAAEEKDGSLGAHIGMRARAAGSEFSETRSLEPSSLSFPAAGIHPLAADTAQQGWGQADLREPYTPLPLHTPLDDAHWRSSPEGDGAVRPLSPAQIDQVLAALDERLELMLLRLYGTSGGG